VKCAVDASVFTINTDCCCGHFFIGGLAPLTTNPCSRTDHHYLLMHLLRIVARALLRAGNLQKPSKVSAKQLTIDPGFSQNSDRVMGMKAMPRSTLWTPVQVQIPVLGDCQFPG
jgi:hypothetical protein